MEQIKKYYIFIVLIVIITIGIICIPKQKEIEEPTIEIEQEKIEEEPKKIKIDIKGEVQAPGVYELKENDRVSDAIIKSGGLTENADTELINLSKTLKDEMVIIIYNKYEIEEIRQKSDKQETIIKYIEKKCTCPDKTNDACINKPTTETNEPSKENKISLNNATQEELETLPGIGESKAKQIIEYRNQNGGFKEIEEIKNISGIGESTFEKFKDHIM